MILATLLLGNLPQIRPKVDGQERGDERRDDRDDDRKQAQQDTPDASLAWRGVGRLVRNVRLVWFVGIVH